METLETCGVKILSSIDLSNVLKEVLPVASKWYNLGLELSLESHELDMIRATYSAVVEDCLREMLKKWLSRPSPTWNSLVAALNQPTVDNPSLAAQIKEKYGYLSDQPEPVNDSIVNESKDIPNVPDTTRSTNSIQFVRNDVLLVQPQQQMKKPTAQCEQKSDPIVVSTTAKKPVKRIRNDDTDPDLPKPKKQVHCFKYTNRKYEFTKIVPDDLLCHKCGQLPNNPHQMKCCHKLYCESCLPKKADRRYRNTTFQECSKEYHKQYECFRDGRSNAQIQSLNIRCLNNSSGCEWQGELCKFEEHQSKCPKEKIPCNFREIGCRKLVYRDSVKEHEVQDREKHLDYAMKTIITVKKDNSDLLQQLGNLKKVVEQNQQELKLEIARFHHPPIIFLIHDPNFNSNLQFFQGKVWCTDCFYTHRQGYKVCLCLAAVPVHHSHFTQPNLETFEYLIRLVTVNKPAYLPPKATGTITVVIMREGGIKGEVLPLKFEIGRTMSEAQLPKILVPWIDIRASAWHEIPDEAFPFTFIFQEDAVCKKKTAVEKFQDLYFRVDEVKFD